MELLWIKTQFAFNNLTLCLQSIAYSGFFDHDPQGGNVIAGTC